MTITKPKNAGNADQAPGLPRDYLDRRRLLADREQAAQVAETVCKMLAAGQKEELQAELGQYYPPDLADVMRFLDDVQDEAVFDLLSPVEQAAVLDEVDEGT